MQTLSPLAENTLIVSWTFTGLAIIFFCVAIFTHRRIELHDIFSLAALITGLALVAQMTWAVLKEGEGEHQRNIPLEIVPSLAKVREQKLIIYRGSGIIADNISLCC